MNNTMNNTMNNSKFVSNVSYLGKLLLIASITSLLSEATFLLFREGSLFTIFFPVILFFYLTGEVRKIAKDKKDKAESPAKALPASSQEEFLCANTDWKEKENV